MIYYPLRLDRDLTNGNVRIIDDHHRVVCEMLCDDATGVAAHIVVHLNDWFMPRVACHVEAA
jgi:hypothetical protein